MSKWAIRVLLSVVGTEFEAGLTIAEYLISVFVNARPIQFFLLVVGIFVFLSVPCGSDVRCPFSGPLE